MLPPRRESSSIPLTNRSAIFTMAGMRAALTEASRESTSAAPVESTALVEKKDRESTPFRLMNLPFVPMKFVATKFDIRDVLPLSLTSDKFKQLMKSMKVESPKFILKIDDHMTLDTGISQLPKYVFKIQDPKDLSKCTLGICTCGQIWRTQNGEPSWSRPNFGVKEWINHLIEIFHCTRIDMLDFAKHDVFDAATIDNLSKELLIVPWKSIFMCRSFPWMNSNGIPNYPPTSYCSQNCCYFPISNYIPNSSY